MRAPLRSKPAAVLARLCAEPGDLGTLAWGANGREIGGDTIAMGNYLCAVWRCRYFWLSLVKMDLRTRYRGSVLGMGWSLLQPIAMTTILCTVFHKLFKTDIRDYALFLISGLICWNFIVSVTVQGCQALFSAETYIRQYPAPMCIYPLRTTLGAAFHLCVALVVVVGLSWLCNGFANIAALPALVPALALVILFGWGMAMLAAMANVFFQDTQHLTEIGFQILFYATPILYPANMLREHHLSWVNDYNPVVLFLRLFREPIVEGHIPSLTTYAAAALAVLLTLGAAAFGLARVERRIVFHL